MCVRGRGGGNSHSLSLKQVFLQMLIGLFTQDLFEEEEHEQKSIGRPTILMPKHLLSTCTNNDNSSVYNGPMVPNSWPTRTDTEIL